MPYILFVQTVSAMLEITPWTAQLLRMRANDDKDDDGDGISECTIKRTTR